MMQNQLAALSSATVSTVEQKDGGDAPPKQVALAMERLAQAARLIADVRLGADRFLEALLATEDQRQLKKSLQLIVKAESSMRQHLQDLRNLGKQLEESGVLNQSLKSRGDSWGLHMPLVCPDGAVVAYAWKRQLAGQAGASAVDRTRLALKAFTDQKKRFFPHLEEDTASHSGASEFGLAKRHYGSQGLVDSIRGSSLGDTRTLSDILFSFEKETPNMKIFTYQRLDWSRRVSTLSPSSSASSSDPSKEQNYPNKPRLGLLGSTPMDQVAIIELFVPLVFRAVVSLHPAGSTNPDSVAFFSPDEGGNYIHARGISVHHVFKHLTEHADKALQYFLSIENDGALDLLLHWIASYQTLFSKACSKCRRLIVVDKSFGLLLPPVYRSYQQTLSAKQSTPQSTESTKELTPDRCSAYHIGCYSDES